MELLGDIRATFMNNPVPLETQKRIPPKRQYPFCSLKPLMRQESYFALS